MLRKPGAYDEPRVHYAVNCASVGCPMLREEAFVAARLEAQLEEQARRFQRRSLPVLIQKMVRGGREVILGSFQDRQFGTLLMFGLGGIFVEAMKDVAFRIHPITDLDAREMIASIRGYPLLQGFRGEKGVNLRFLEEMLLRLSQLLADFPQIEQVDVVGNTRLTAEQVTTLAGIADGETLLRIDAGRETLGHGGGCACQPEHDQEAKEGNTESHGCAFRHARRTGLLT
mgnify:CR=1 FL=1